MARRGPLGHLLCALATSVVVAIFLGMSPSTASASSPFGFIPTPYTGSYNLWDVCYGGDRFVAVGGGGVALTSTDGRSWTEVELPISSDLVSVAYGGGRFVAVGYYGTIVSSGDGQTWVDCGLGGALTVLAVEYAGSRFVAVGSQGFVATSPDGVQWTFGGLSEDQVFIDVAYGNGMIVAITVLGRIYTTVDGASWEWQQWSSVATSWVKFVSGRFLVHSLGLGGTYEIRS